MMLIHIGLLYVNLILHLALQEAVAELLDDYLQRVKGYSKQIR